MGARPQYRYGVALVVSLALHAVALLTLSAPRYVSNPDTTVRIRLIAPEIVSNIKEPLNSIAEQVISNPGRNTQGRHAPVAALESKPQNVEEALEPGRISSSVDAPSGRNEEAGSGEAGTSGGDLPIETGLTGNDGIKNSSGGGNAPEPGGNIAAPRIDREALIASYREQVLAAISAHKTYPPAARRTGREGGVRVGFRVDGNGAVSNIEVVSSSGSDALDGAAVQAVEGSSPLPSPPAELGESLSLVLTIVFSLD